MPAHRSHCAHCLQPLTALSRALGRARCDATACRAKEGQMVMDRLWAGVGQQAVQRAAACQPPSTRPPLLLWLEDAGRDLVPVTDADRAGLAARWMQAWQQGSSVEFDGEDTAADLPAQAAALCGHCGGRCCAYGSTQAAFIGAATLRRWLETRPGATVDDAIADYLARLPAAHVQGQCCFQGASGCALPRQQRSDICNRYRCAALNQLGVAVSADPTAAAVVLTRNGQHLDAAAWFQHGHAKVLHGVQGPDELGDAPV